MSDQHRCPYCEHGKFNFFERVLEPKFQAICDVCGARGPWKGARNGALDEFCLPACLREELEAGRAFEHEVLIGRNEQHERLLARIRELEARPPIDRERLVEAIKAARLGLLTETPAEAADAILRHLGQPAEAPKPAGEVCRWRQHEDRGNPMSRECGPQLWYGVEAPSRCPGCGRRVEVSE